MDPREPETNLAFPLPPSERLLSVDVLRGAALFGILAVNMLAFSGPWAAEAGPLGYWRAPLDRAAEWAILVFAEGAFYSQFSFLFGLGFALQLVRAGRRGEDPAPRFRRRLLVLLGFGLVHLFLIWSGDILTHYALIGFALVAFRRMAAAELLRWAGGLFTLAVLLALALAPLQAEQFAATDAADLVALHGLGDWSAMFASRVQDGLDALLATPLLLPGLLWLFLLGLAAGRAELFARLPERRRLLRLILGAALVVAALCKGLYGWLLLVRPQGSLGVLLSTGIGGPALGAVYLTSLALLLSRPGPAARLRPLAAVGRMALSNYLAQSVVATLAFYGYGLGLYGRLGPAATLLFTAGLFALQVLASSLWLARFRFGPAEWLWRSLTYGRLQPLR